MAQICLIRPDGPSRDIQHDFNGWAAQTLAEIQAAHTLVTDYNGTYTSVPTSLSGDVGKSDAVIFYGHGQWDLLEIRDSSGTSRPWFVSSPASGTVSAGALTAKIMVAIACQAGHKFGPDAITLGAAAFIGFDDDVGIIPTPGLQSNHFRDGFTGGPTEVLSALAKGLSPRKIATNAATEAKDLFQKAYDYFKTDPQGAAHPNAPRARRWAHFIRDHVVGLW